MSSTTCTITCISLMKAWKLFINRHGIGLVMYVVDGFCFGGHFIYLFIIFFGGGVINNKFLKIDIRLKI